MCKNCLHKCVKRELSGHSGPEILYVTWHLKTSSVQRMPFKAFGRRARWIETFTMRVLSIFSLAFIDFLKRFWDVLVRQLGGLHLKLLGSEFGEYGHSHHSLQIISKLLLAFVWGCVATHESVPATLRDHWPLELILGRRISDRMKGKNIIKNKSC